jgi:hypothetical protein
MGQLGRSSMRKLLLAACLAALAAALYGQGSAGRVLYVYDEVNDNSRPYIGYFEKALAAEGIAYDEATATEAGSKDISQYRAILVHGMVMAFASKSPVRDWLKAENRLEGRRVALFVTANRWFLAKLSRQLADLLKKDKAGPVDAVSTATKSMDDASKEAAVKSFVTRQNKDPRGEGWSAADSPLR